jgi:hypothetical protein
MKMSTADPREVPELKVPERPHGPLVGAGAEGPRAPTIDVKTSMADPERCQS